MDANDVVVVAPVVLSTSNRHGVPRAPDARVSPRPTATSASSDVAFASSDDRVDAVCTTNDTSEGTISCVSTAIRAADCLTPAAARASTARRLNSDAYTSFTAFESSSADDASTPRTESYNPAADIPARSSTLALERTATRAFGDDDVNAAAMDAHTSGGISIERRISRAASHASSSAA
eukprot:30954-Pelagococcus_subviridis.AAC.3